MSDLLKGLAWVALLAIALLFFLGYSVYKLNQRASAINNYNESQEESQGIETSSTLDSYEANIAMVAEPIIKKKIISI